MEFFAVLPGNSADGGTEKGFFPGFLHRVFKVCGHFAVFREISRRAAPPGVASLAPSGQFTFCQSPGTAFVFAHSTRRLHHRHSLRSPRPDGLAMTDFFVQRYAGPPSHVIARSEATRRSPGTAFVFVHSPRRLHHRHSLRSPRACGPRNDSGGGKVVRFRRGAVVVSVHSAERRGRRSLRSEM